MYEWVNATLDASAGGEAAGTGLFWDKLRGDDTVDTMFWSYNQGSMVGANVLLARGRTTATGGCLARAEAIARKALRHYHGDYERQAPAFNAIFFRNLLLLHDATGDEDLRTRIMAAMRGYADHAWSERRDRRDRFHFPRDAAGAGRGVTLLGQSAMVQVLALLAWEPERYSSLA